MHILHTIPSMGILSGGPAFSTALTVQGERMLGIDAHILTYDTYMSKDHNIITAPYVHTIPVPRDKKFMYSDSYRKALHNTSADLIHIQGIWQYPSLSGAFYARRNKKPYVITLRGMLYPHSFEKSSFIKRISLWFYLKSDLQHASCLHATCREEMEHLRNMGISSPIAVIPNPILVEKKNDNITIPEKVRIGYLGRVHPRKRIERLLYVSDKLRGVRFELIIIGDGDAVYMQYLRNEVDRLKLTNVVFTGFVSGIEKVNVLDSLSFLIIPSDFENFGNVVVESLVRGIPVIASKGTPWQELNIHQCGWWVDNDVETLTHTVREALSLSNEKRIEMGERGKRLIKENYSVEIVASKMKRLYDWILYNGEKPEFVYLK